MKIDVKIVRPETYETFPLPRHAHDGDAGIDLRAAIPASKLIHPGDKLMVPTGLEVAVPPGIVMLLVPRSGLGIRSGIILSNGTGVIDPTYRGEVQVALWNTSDNPFTVNPGDRVCQALFVPFYSVTLNPVESLTSTERGDGGFGSTGVTGEPEGAA